MDTRGRVDAPVARRFGRAWVGLAVCLALHVTDEALTDFLAVYNPIARAIRERAPWLPVPVFGFTEWIAGLAAGIVLLLALAPLAFRGHRRLLVLALPFSVLMAANALGHLGGSLYCGRVMPGAISSPLLLAAAALTFAAARQALRSGAAAPIG